MDITLSHRFHLSYKVCMDPIARVKPLIHRRYRVGSLVIASLMTLVASGPCHQAAAAREIYIGRGGTELVVLDRTSETLSASNHPLAYYARLYSHAPIRFVPECKDSVLTLTLENLTPPDSDPPGMWRPRGSQVFQKSPIHQGDYDKVGDTILRNKDSANWTAPADKAYLHRLDEPLLLDYFTLLDDTPSTAMATIAPRLLQIGQRLIAAHPTDLHVRVVYWDALLRNSQTDQLRAELATWKAAVAATPHRWIAFEYSQAEEELASLECSRSATNAFDIVEAFHDGRTGLKEFLTTFPAVLRAREYREPIRGLITRGPDYLPLQILAKVTRVAATLMLMDGRRDEARALLLSCYRLGQMLNARNVDIERLIGIAVRAISIGGLEVYAKDCTQTPEELASLYQTLIQFEQNPPPRSGISLSDALGVPPSPILYLEKQVREAHTDAKFHLLCAAIATRYKVLTTGRFPQKPDDFGALLPNGLPADPFTSGTLRFRPDYPQPFAVYSVGPDRIDQLAGISYDPTNGTVSAGDVVMTISREPKYPFPLKPLHSSTRDQLLAQLPNGLPVDIFANTWGLPLSVSNTTPVRVFSFGPGTNQQDTKDRYDIEQYMKGPPIGINGITVPTPTPHSSNGYKPPYIPLVLYDPTNGIISGGDLYINIPPR